MDRLDTNAWSTVKIKKGNRFINANVYEIYTLEVYGRPTGVFSVPWIVWLNVTAMFGYIIGSVFFLWDWGRDTALYVFAVASLLDAFACIGMMQKAINRRQWLTVAGDVNLVVGCVVFAVTSIPWLFTTYRTPIVICWIVSGVFFLFGCAMMQAVLVSSVGWWGAFFSVPLEGLNILGAVFFIVGAALILDPSFHIVGTWNFIVGSVVFFLTSIASIIVASIHTPSDHSVKLMYATTQSFDATFDLSMAEAVAASGTGNTMLRMGTPAQSVSSFGALSSARSTKRGPQDY